jgi:hypothetical protein
MGRRREKRFRIEEAAGVDQGNSEILGKTLAVMQMNSTLAIIKLGETGIAGATKHFAHSIRQDDGGWWDGRHIVKVNHLVAGSPFDENATITHTGRVMIGIISDMEARMIGAIRSKEGDVPEKIKAGGGVVGIWLSKRAWWHEL